MGYTMNERLKDALIRAGRTFLQTALGVYLAGIIASQTDGLSVFADLTLLEAAAAAGLVAVLSFVQNYLEMGSSSVNYNRG